MYEYIAEQENNIDFAKNILRIDDKKLDAIEQAKKEGGKFAEKIEIPKKRGGTRVVYKVVDEFAELYKNLNLTLNRYFTEKIEGFPHIAVYGYVKGKNILENAKVHCGKRNVMKIDLKDFFNSISEESIASKLESIGEIKNGTATPMAQFLCIDKKLPLGLCTSPLVSNIVCFEMDKEIHKKCEGEGLKYTRYADDITISSGDKNKDLLKLKDYVYKIITKHGFEANEDKFRITKNGMSHFVTGLSVSDNVPHVPKKMKKLLRQKLYHIGKRGFDAHCNNIKTYKWREYRRINGYFWFMQSIENGNKNAKEIWKKWQNIKTLDRNIPNENIACHK